MELKGTFRYLGGYGKYVNGKQYYNGTIIQSGHTEPVGVSEEVFAQLKEMEEYTGIFRYGHFKERTYLNLIGLDK